MDTQKLEAELLDRFERAAMAYERLGKLARDDEKTRAIRKDTIADLAAARGALLCALAGAEADRVDAERWRALLRCARIRMFGSAGFNPKTGEREEYSNATGEMEKSDRGWVHFGAEFWSVYPGHEDENPETRWGTIALIALADDVLLKEAAAGTALGGKDAR